MKNTKLPKSVLSTLVTTQKKNRTWDFLGIQISWTITRVANEYELKVSIGENYRCYYLTVKGDKYLQFHADTAVPGTTFEPPSPEEIELLVTGMIEGKEDWKVPPEVLRQIIVGITGLEATFEMRNTAFTVWISNCPEEGTQYFELWFEDEARSRCMWKTDPSLWTLGPLVYNGPVEEFPHKFTLPEYLMLANALRRAI